jgi:hypothetical protein
MKKIFLNKKNTFILILLFAFGCSNNNSNNYSSEDFLVSHVYNFQDELIAKYNYNNSSQLIKATYFHLTPDITENIFFTYSGNLLVGMETIYLEHPEYDFENTYYYDNNRNLIKVKISYSNEQTFTYYLKYDSNNRLTNLCNQDEVVINHYDYDENLDIVKQTDYLKDPITGIESERITSYTYDNFNKPPFGMNAFYFRNLLPLDELNDFWVESFSKNNLTYSELNNIHYLYEYNKYNLPIAILPKKEGNYLNEKLIKIDYIIK